MTTENLKDQLRAARAQRDYYRKELEQVQGNLSAAIQYVRRLTYLQDQVAELQVAKDRYIELALAGSHLSHDQMVEILKTARSPS